MNIKRTLKRLIDDTQYVAALEKQNDLLKENLQQKKVLSHLTLCLSATSRAL